VLIRLVEVLGGYVLLPKKFAFPSDTVAIAV
jgi:hypothetical protein